MKCGEFKDRLERLKSNFEYTKRLIKDYERTGKEEEESIEFWVQNLDMEASFFKDRLTTSSEREAEAIMGKDNFVGTRIAQDMFNAVLDVHDGKIPFSLAELMQAKLDGKMLLYRPDYSTGKITPEKLLTQIGFNNPQRNMKFFTDEHRFDFDQTLNMILRHPLKSLEIEKSSWNLLKFWPEGSPLGIARELGVLPSVTEAIYDILASKKVSKFLYQSKNRLTWTSTDRFAIFCAAPGGQMRLNPVIKDPNEWHAFYTCESREVD